MPGRALLRTVEAWLAGGWLGSWGLFAAVVAPSAFRVLPGDTAGELVAPVLRMLHLYGLVAGLALFAIAFALRRGWWSTVLPLALSGLCAVTEFGVSAAIAQVRPSEFSLDTPEGAAARFHQLHLVSRVLFATGLAGSAALVALHAWSPTGEDARAAESLQGGDFGRRFP